MTDLKRPEAYKYALATGDEAAHRLALLHSVYGPDAERILESIGIGQGNRVADFGCGTGATIPWFAKHVGSSGEVVGLDASAAQLAIAERMCVDAQLLNVRFVEADVYTTGLPRNSFDAVHCRLLLCHLQRPPFELLPVWCHHRRDFHFLDFWRSLSLTQSFLAGVFCSH